MRTTETRLERTQMARELMDEYLSSRQGRRDSESEPASSARESLNTANRLSVSYSGEVAVSSEQMRTLYTRSSHSGH